ncbi:hypothetical protein CLOM_g2605 [Closterium sp. NIES-68]|nr:hypothetical protein CLOM_g2605 [Closterium sp. NIES-68]
MLMLMPSVQREIAKATERVRMMAVTTAMMVMMAVAAMGEGAETGGDMASARHLVEQMRAKRRVEEMHHKEVRDVVLGRWKQQSHRNITVVRGAALPPYIATSLWGQPSPSIPAPPFGMRASSLLGQLSKLPKDFNFTNGQLWKDWAGWAFSGVHFQDEGCTRKGAGTVERLRTGSAVKVCIGSGLAELKATRYGGSSLLRSTSSSAAVVADDWCSCSS